jgi:hypothetical protein
MQEARETRRKPSPLEGSDDSDRGIWSAQQLELRACQGREPWSLGLRLDIRWICFRGRVNQNWTSPLKMEPALVTVVS